MIGNDWDNELKIIWDSPGFHKFWDIVMHEYATKDIFPAKENIFNALKLTPYCNVKVVIVGQDPYHGEGQAHGLCFSVMPGVVPPPSLKNIFKEMQDDVHTTIPNHGCLVSWAKQGVLLLNTVLTVREGMPNSHAKFGWQTFTDEIIRKVNEKKDPVVFILWGANAKAKIPLITNPNHLILYSAHPSPLSAYNGFFGCKHFSKTNQFLKEHGRKEIDWQIPNIVKSDK